MRKLNNINKFFILLFSLIIVGIVVLLVFSMNKSGTYDNLTAVYNLSTNSIIYNYDDVLLDTKNGGELKKSWDSKYYFVSFDGNTVEVGDRAVIYDKAKEEVSLFGENYYISQAGNVTKNEDQTMIKDTNEANFYKLDDRSYLIVGKEIYSEDKTVFTSKYLIVNLDKQGNASFLNDAINFKTINPIKLTFNNYVFDIANEKLTVDGNSIDLKLVKGSTNEYIPVEKNKYEDPNMKEFIDSYNKLVNDFSQYVNNTNLIISSTNQIVNNTIVTKPNNSNNATSESKNKTNINKRVSLRGIVAFPTYLDVSYVVTDPEEKYQAVYLLITGLRNGEMLTEKVLLDKYDTSYRIVNLGPKNEYSVSLGYVELGEDKTLYDNIEDVINVRTTGADMSIEVEKIVPGYVTCNFKMTDKYAIQSGKLTVLGDGHEIDSVDIKKSDALSKNGFTAKLKIEDANVYEIVITEAVYNGNPVDLDVNAKFTYQSLRIE